MAFGFREFSTRKEEAMHPITGDWTERSRQLLQAAEAGDADALGELLELFRTYLTVIAGEEMPDELRPKFNPSDVVQDTFLEAARLFDRFQGTERHELRGWLRGILLNKLRDLHRRYFEAQNREVGREQSLDDSSRGRPLRGELVNPDSSPSRQAVRNEEERRLNEAMARLPEEYRLVLVARSWEGLSFAEIGRKLQRSEDAARMLHLRALGRLQEEMRRNDAPQRPGDTPGP
jgi:RNA polymerase sigma-70 factor (ECF subfamily)